MTKAEIVKEISRQTGIDREAVLNVVENFMSVVKDSMAQGENIYLRGFGTFAIKERKEKIGRNINAKTAVVIPATRKPTFKPCPEFKEAVAK